MALFISDECINCDVCEPVCPNKAIIEGPIVYEILAHRCTECVGHFDEPQCVVICPIACIEKDPNCIEDHDTLLAKKLRLENNNAPQSKKPITPKPVEMPRP